MAVAIFTLAIQPGVDLLCQQLEQQETCCAGHCQLPVEEEATAEETDRHLPGSCEGENCCNPFQVCCTCLLQCLEIPQMALAGPVFFTQENFSYHYAHSALFTSEFWQPPRQV